MGEAADNLLDGTLCEECGELVDGTSPGHPRTCETCLRVGGEPTYEHDDYQECDESEDGDVDET